MKIVYKTIRLLPDNAPEMPSRSSYINNKWLPSALKTIQQRKQMKKQKYSVKMAEFDAYKRNSDNIIVDCKRYWCVFDGPIFMGNGNLSMWKSENLKAQVAHLIEHMSGLQQGGKPDEEYTFLQNNIKNALKLC